MSVQAGIWNFDGEPVNLGLLGALSESLKQQGPDGDSRYVNSSVAMLYRPFHTTVESHLEKQPYFSHRGFVLTWDGRLDNREVLIADLRNDLDDSPTDLVIFAAALDRWDTDCFHRLVGDWAVTIWKPEHRELLFASDYMGVRHIFYFLNEDRIWWSTDLVPLVLLPRCKFHIDEGFIAGYLANDPDAYLTPYREIREVPPGQFVRIRNGAVRIERHWQFSPRLRISYRTDAEYEEHFRHVFRQSVRRRLRSDSPILAELSGGLDSSSVVCMADDILVKQNEHSERLDTLSYYDKSEPNGDDATYFQIVEEARGRTGAHIDLSVLGDYPASLENPDFSPLPGYFGARRKVDAERASVVRQGGYRVVLSGLGGDEFMGGIPDPRAQLADLILQFNFVQLVKQLAAWSLIKRKPWIQLLWQSLTELLPVSLAERLLKEARVEPWIDISFARRTKLARRLIRPHENVEMWLPTARSFVSGVLLMSDKLAKFGSPVFQHEENRYPYLDQTLVEFVLSIPPSQLLRPGERRSLMRRALVGTVPHEVLSRRTKQFGVRTPVVALQATWRELEIAIESPLSSRLGYINRSRLLGTLQAIRNGKEAHIVRMLKLISLEFWLRDLVARGLLEGSLDGRTMPPSPFTRSDM